MDLIGIKRLEELQARLVASQSAVQFARENLIESLGDNLCGSGSGPTREQLKIFARARRTEAKIQQEMAEFVATLTLAAASSQATGSNPFSRP